MRGRTPFISPNIVSVSIDAWVPKNQFFYGTHQILMKNKSKQTQIILLLIPHNPIGFPNASRYVAIMECKIVGGAYTRVKKGEDPMIPSVPMSLSRLRMEMLRPAE